MRFAWLPDDDDAAEGDRGTVLFGGLLFSGEAAVSGGGVGWT